MSDPRRAAHARTGEGHAHRAGTATCRHADDGDPKAVAPSVVDRAKGCPGPTVEASRAETGDRLGGIGPCQPPHRDAGAGDRLLDHSGRGHLPDDGRQVERTCDEVGLAGTGSGSLSTTGPVHGDGPARALTGRSRPTPPARGRGRCSWRPPCPPGSSLSAHQPGEWTGSCVPSGAGTHEGAARRRHDLNKTCVQVRPPSFDSYMTPAVLPLPLGKMT